MNLTLPFPPSANRYWRLTTRNGKPRIIKSVEAEGYATRCYWVAKSQIRQPLTGPVCLDMTIYFPNRRGDLDNRTKQLFDALEGVVFANDRQIEHYSVTRAIDKKNPRVEIQVTAIEEPPEAA